MIDKGASRTRERILTIAAELFGRRSYAGTSIADIAGQLGSSKAAIYYHFASKEEILGTLIDKPLSIYEDIAASALLGAPAEELLGRLIDLMADPRAGFAMFDNDPSARFEIDQRAVRHNLVEKTDQIIMVLAGADATLAGRVRACAAFAVAKEGTRMALWGGTGTLSPEVRAELLAAALAALSPETQAPGEASSVRRTDAATIT